MGREEEASPKREGTFHYISDTGALGGFLSGVQESVAPGPGGRLRCSIDTEADSLHSYREKLCLVQFECGGHLAIIDPLTIDDLAPLKSFLDAAEVWLHGCDFDLLMLRRTFGEIPPVVRDTQIAARLVGYERFGLGAMVEQLFDVTLSKSSQRADWGKRPLPDKMVEYALNDVRYVVPMADMLIARLSELGREPWFVESCERTCQDFLNRPEKSEDDVWRISGWGKLQPRGLAFLRALWFWRDGEAERLDRPAFKVVNNDVLIRMAGELQAGEKASFPQRLRSEQRRRLVEAIAEARRLGKDDFPTKRRPPARWGTPREENEAGFKALRSRRDSVASDLGVEPSLVATRLALEIMSVRPGDAPELLMDWQRDVLFPDGKVAFWEDGDR